MSAVLHRHEYKYLVDGATAERIRRHIAGFCERDAFAPTGSYLCDTLYLDTLQLGLYHATVEDEPVRFKLRVRGYPEAPDAPTFLEVKRRLGDTIVKHRAGVRGDWGALLADGRLLDTLQGKTREAAEQFLARWETSYAGPYVPTVLVRYRREPYTSLVDDYVRVTFDRELRYQPHATLDLRGDDDRWISIDDPIATKASPTESLAILELKFGDVPPSWMRQLIARLELPRASFCKYARAVDAMLLRPEYRLSRML